MRADVKGLRAVEHHADLLITSSVNLETMATTTIDNTSMIVALDASSNFEDGRSVQL